MTKTEALDWIKVKHPDDPTTALARILRITQSAVSQWDDNGVPELQQRKLVELSAGHLKLDRKYLLSVK
jgi:phage terminase Nu1 subunit (DNA packaging protein)